MLTIGLCAPAWGVDADLVDVHQFIRNTHSKRHADRYATLVVRKARQYEIPPMLLARLIDVESGYNPVIRSYANARGLMQVMPFHFRPGEDWRDPAQNLDAGCRILRAYKKRFYGWHPALVAYNRGPGNGPHRGLYRTRYSERVMGETR